MKNDITYEYRVFTNRLIDVESMEVGICTSKVINELKPKNKVDGRFFHTSDTDEWFFCWNGELQKLNLKGDSDVSAALAEVEKLISDAKVAVEDAKKTAGEAKNAADAAKNAADSATAAVETIENKADKSEVESLSKKVEEKADKSTIESLSEKVDAIPSVDKIALKEEIPNVPTKVSELENDSNYLTEQDIKGKQDIISDLESIRSGAAAGTSALSEAKAYVDGKGYVTEEFVGGEIKKINVPTKVSQLENDSNYLTSDAADLKYAPIGSEGVDLSSYATKVYVGEEIKKINVPTKVSQLENDSNYLTEQSLTGYATEEFVGEEIKKIVIPEVPSMDNYYTKENIDTMIKGINDLIGEAEEKTNEILG